MNVISILLKGETDAKYTIDVAGANLPARTSYFKCDLFLSVNLFDLCRKDHQTKSDSSNRKTRIAKKWRDCLRLSAKCPKSTLSDQSSLPPRRGTEK